MSCTGTNYHIVETGGGFSVMIAYPTGGTGMRRGFQSEGDAAAWIERDRATAGAVTTMRRDFGPNGLG
jgi:hypothetical protein